MKRKSILKSYVSTGSYQEFIEVIFLLVENNLPSYVCFANVHMIVEAYKNKAFRHIVNSADLVAPDGRPLSIFLRWFKGVDQERVCGMDILPDLLAGAERFGKSVFFYGSTNHLLSIIIKKARQEFPKLRIVGSLSPPFKEQLTNEESAAIMKQVNEAKPDLIFVSLGCPKQEKWMAENKHKVNACMLGLGQAFQVYAGIEKRLPKWMRSFSLEWAYRLYLEPRRLWKRYAYTNSYFLLLVCNYAINYFSRRFFHS